MSQRVDVVQRDASRDLRWRLAADLVVSGLVSLTFMALAFEAFALLFLHGGCIDTCSTRMQDNLTRADLAAMRHLGLLIALAVGLAASAVTYYVRRRRRARSVD